MCSEASSRHVTRHLSHVRDVVSRGGGRRHSPRQVSHPPPGLSLSFPLSLFLPLSLSLSLSLSSSSLATRPPDVYLSIYSVTQARSSQNTHSHTHTLTLSHTLSHTHIKPQARVCGGMLGCWCWHAHRMHFTHTTHTQLSLSLFLSLWFLARTHTTHLRIHMHIKTDINVFCIRSLGRSGRGSSASPTSSPTRSFL